MKLKIKNITSVSLFTALLVICSWITIPFTVPFTLQTLAVFCACLILGGKLATLCTSVYVLLGAVGLPVFSYMGAGVGALFGATGGFIMGFIGISAVYYLVTRVFGDGDKVKLFGGFAGLIFCYFLGTVWYVLFYTYSEVGGIMSALFTCVIPYILPDIIKLLLAFFLYTCLRKRYRIKFY